MGKYYRVEVVGFHFGALDPKAPRDFPYQALQAHPWPDFRNDAHTLREWLRGRVIYAMKPRPTSYGLALWHRLKTQVPVVVDIDDNELSMIPPYSKYALKNFVYGLPKLQEPNGFAYTWALDGQIHQANAITVVSRHFQRRYGGTLIPQYVDTDCFDPARYDAAEIRRAEGLGNDPAIAFVGIAQPNKGVAEVLKAMEQLTSDWKLWIVGPKTPYALELALNPRVRLVGTQPPEKAPAFLAAANMVVLPQVKGPHSDGQMPIKLFEAMAMAKPIVATGLADIPEVLNGCGIVATPGDIDTLAKAMQALEENPELGKSLGEKARIRCEREFSWNHGIQVLRGIFDPLLEAPWTL